MGQSNVIASSNRMPTDGLGAAFDLAENIAMNISRIRLVTVFADYNNAVPARFCKRKLRSRGLKLNCGGLASARIVRQDDEAFGDGIAGQDRQWCGCRVCA